MSREGWVSNGEVEVVKVLVVVVLVVMVGVWKGKLNSFEE